MKKLIAVIVLFVLIGAADLIYTYNSYGSLFWKMNREKSAEMTENAADKYVYERPEHKPKLPETECEVDFVNQVDPDEYFGDDPVYDDDKGGYLVSHNVFDTTDGGQVKVDIFSSKYNDGIFGGRMDMSIRGKSGAVNTPCAYDSDVRSALKYTYSDHFALLLDDYNFDGNPDYVFRTGEPAYGGAFYYIEYATNESYPVHHTNFLTPKRNSDSAVFVYGRSADSIRLAHTDMEHFFFLTRTDDGIEPYMYSSDFRECSYDAYAVGGRLYSAFYENGVLTLTATDCSEDMEMYSDGIPVNIRKYDERIWKSCGSFTAEDFVSESNLWERSAAYETKLEKGLYQLEIATPDGTAYAEFMVRK